MKTQAIATRRRRTMLALRNLMDLPEFRPVNDSILFCSAAAFDKNVGMQLAGLAQAKERDIICLHWADPEQVTPASYTVVLRELMGVSVVSDCKPWTWGTGNVVLVSRRLKQTFGISLRGMMIRSQSVPDHLRLGFHLAEERMAKMVGSRRNAKPIDLSCSGISWIEPGAPIEPFVRID